jgi:hypothetical protein
MYKIKEIIFIILDKKIKTRPWEGDYLQKWSFWGHVFP